MTIYASHFSNNTASISGGALYSSDSNVTIRECQFNSNMANLGKGLYSTGSVITIRGTSLFDNITAAYREGVLHSSNSIIIIEPGLNISNSDVTAAERGTLQNSISTSTISMIGLPQDLVSEADVTTYNDSLFISSTRTGVTTKTLIKSVPLTTTEETSRLIDNQIIIMEFRPVARLRAGRGGGVHFLGEVDLLGGAGGVLPQP